MSFTREKIAALILAGQSIVIYRANVLRIPQFWLDAHPGGSLSIAHFVGRDATDEIDAYHNEEALALVHKYSIGKLVDPIWHPFLPPIMAGWSFESGNWINEAQLDSTRTQLHQGQVSQGTPTIDDLAPPVVSSIDAEVQARQALAYRELHKRIIAAGLYKCPFVKGYGPEFARYILLATISIVAYRNNWLMTSAAFLGLLWHQIMFFIHDLGHMGLTGKWNVDRVISTVFADFIAGLSVGWWVDSHNIHHLVTNHPAHDPDIGYLPFFAITPVFFNSIYTTFYKRNMTFDAFAQAVVSIQHKLFYIILMFGRFNLYQLSYFSLYKRAYDTKRARGNGWAWNLEFIGILSYWAWYGSVLYGCGSLYKAVGYLLVSHIITTPLHITNILSHFSMSTEDLGPGESFAHRQLRTTTDIFCPESLAFMHGGLQLQVAHHLFPRIPRHNLRTASNMVKEFATEQGLTYFEFGFISGSAEVVSLLKEVADMVQHFKVFAEVAEGEAAEHVEAAEKAMRAQEAMISLSALNEQSAMKLHLD